MVCDHTLSTHFRYAVNVCEDAPSRRSYGDEFLPLPNLGAQARQRQPHHGPLRTIASRKGERARIVNGLLAGLSGGNADRGAARHAIYRIKIRVKVGHLRGLLRWAQFVARFSDQTRHRILIEATVPHSLTPFGEGRPKSSRHTRSRTRLSSARCPGST